MRFQRRIYQLAAAGLLGASALAAGSAAQAREVYWSIGVGSPGVQVNASNAPSMVYARPVMVVPQPVYYAQPPVVYHPPQVVYGPPRVVYAPQPYYVQSGWVQPGYRQGWGPRHRGHQGRWDRDGRDGDDHRHGFDGARPGRGQR